MKDNRKYPEELRSHEDKQEQSTRKQGRLGLLAVWQDSPGLCKRLGAHLQTGPLQCTVRVLFFLSESHSPWLQNMIHTPEDTSVQHPQCRKHWTHFISSSSTSKNFTGGTSFYENALNRVEFS